MTNGHSTFDFQQINELTEDDPDFRKELLGSYIHTFEAFPAEYTQALRQGGAGELRFLIHRVKASVRMVGADELDRILEQSPRLLEGNADAQPTISRVTAICQSLVAQMKNL